MTEKAGLLVAEFVDGGAVTAAVRAAKEEGLTRIEAYGPHPMHDIEPLLGAHTLQIPIIAAIAAVSGAVGTYYMQYWMNAVDYPLNVGGRPLHSWPAFIPASIIVGVLASGAATLIGMLVLCGLPRLEHPLFALPGFERATEDRFFVVIARADPRFDERKTVELLVRRGAITVRGMSE